MATPEKIAEVDSAKAAYAQHFESGGGVVFADYFEMTVEEMTELRSRLRKEDGRLKVLKNTLLKRAMVESGIEGPDEFYKGPTVVAFSPDEVTAPKIVAKFAKELDKIKEGKLTIKGAVIGGKIVTSDEVKVLAALPSRDEVMATLLALINTPATNLLRLMNEPATQTARLLKAVAEKSGSAE
ncbi:MAG: 50S ribosomal protein L10 [Candidatus Lindowbacteria bacterium]|nr:50S ribosomal protein L10 [Candidatus Lindowbacteria bacterium]